MRADVFVCRHNLNNGVMIKGIKKGGIWMGLEKIESFLGGHIEGFFNRRFSSDLEPVEMAEGLRKAIRRLAVDYVEEGIPPLILFTLNPQDCSRLCAKRVQDDLCEEIEKG